MKDRPKDKQRTRYLTDAEEARLLEKLPPKYRDVAVFLFDTGCRVNEALTLTWEDVQHHAALDRVTFWRTKTRRPRTVPLTARAQEVLRRAQAEGQSRPFPIAYHAFHFRFSRARDAAGLGRDVVVHTARHTCASRLVQRGASLQKVQLWLGRTSLWHTLRYAHLSPDALDGMTSLLEARP
jgi:integrase